MAAQRAQQHGFSLVEIAIALIIMGLIMGSGLNMIKSRQDLARVQSTQKALADIQDALIGYAISQSPPHLPCPATTNSGLEAFNAATGVCNAVEGNLPWSTLGVADTDAWGHRYHYRVTPAFSNRAPAATPTHLSVGTLRVCQTNACANVIASNVPAIVLSFGPDGYGGMNSNGVVAPLAPAGYVDERQNTNLNNTFVSRPPTKVGSPLGPFDDIVVWLSRSLGARRFSTVARLMTRWTKASAVYGLCACTAGSVVAA